MQSGNFVGVVAPHEYDAIQAAAQLKVIWDNTPSLPGSGNLNSHSAQPGQPSSDGARRQHRQRRSAGSRSAAKTVSATFFSAYNVHGPIGPNCSVADVTPTTATVLCYTQPPYYRRRPRGAGDRPGRRTRCESSSSRPRVPTATAAGRRSVSAAIMSNLVGKPVRVQLMRWDETAGTSWARRR